MGEYSTLLTSHASLASRQSDSGSRIARVREAFANVPEFKDPGLTIFVAGSLGRGESGKRSDLDLFVVTTKSFDESQRNRFLEVIRAAAIALHYEPLTERFLKVYELGDLLRNTGSPKDDEHNSFTARMLMLLESKPAINDDTYSSVLDQVLSQYFRDERGKAAFRPLFLLNDILRYWRTLCLNYEDLRHDQARPWWKKNASLKFSRMLTVFATVATLTIEDVTDKRDFRLACDLCPLQRLARSLDALNDNGLCEAFAQVLEDYEAFLLWKEGDDDSRAGYDGLRARAEGFSKFLFEMLNHERIPLQRRKYLVI